jgi:hypothetical protein
MNELSGDVASVREIVGGSMHYLTADGVGCGAFLDLRVEVDGVEREQYLRFTADSALAAWAILTASLRDLGLELPEVALVDG